MRKTKYKEDLIIVVSRTNRGAAILFDRFLFKAEIFDQVLKISKPRMTVYLSDNRIFSFVGESAYNHNHMEELGATVYTDLEFENKFFKED